MVTVNDIDFDAGAPCRVVTATWNGRTFTAGTRTWAHLFRTQEALTRRYPNYYLYVIQGSYNKGVAASAGSHDFDGTLDVAVVNRRTGRKMWIRGLRLLRRCGWAAWWRNSGSWANPSDWHIHMTSLGCQEAGCPVGWLIPSQIDDYYANRTGLASHLFDPTWHPRRIKATIFNFPRWVHNKEDDMPAPKDWDAEDWKAFEQHVSDGVMESPMNAHEGGEDQFQKETLRSVLKALFRRTNPEGK